MLMTLSSSTQLIPGLSSKKNVETDFIILKNWFDRKLLTINTEKTHLLPFSCTKAGLPPFDHISVENKGHPIHIKLVDDIKYLGLYIDKHLKWNIHINYVIKKLHLILYRFKFLNNYLPLTTMKLLYTALVESHLRYGITAWGSALRVHLNSLEILQKRFLKIILRKDPMYPTNLLYNEFNTMDLRKLYLFHIISRYHFSKEIVFSSHSYNTRQYNYSIPPIVKKSISQRSYSYLTKHCYNFITTDLKNISNKKIFKRKLKYFILNSDRAAVSDLIEIN